MKKTFLISVFLVAGILSLFANSYASGQMLSLNLKQATLREAIESIKKQSEFYFSIDVNDLNLDEKISVSIKNKTIDEALSLILNGRNVQFEIRDRHVIITKAEVANGTTITQQSTKKITGKITDDLGESIIGANVVVKGTTIGTMTNIDGSFTLDVPSNAVLVISYIGYLPQNITVGNKTNIAVSLKEDTQKLDEVIVVGYGTNTKRSLISSVSSVNAEELKNIPVANITQGLAGRAPGLIVKANGGGVNSKSNITIRGGGTPLVVIDGVIRSYDDFVNIAPEDIESLSILKDASATAAYGSRAANGILQISTKRGKNGTKPTIEYSFNQSYSQPNIWPKKLGSYDRAFYINEAKRYDGFKELPYSDEALRKYKDQSDPWNYPDIDWQSEVLRNFSPTQKHNVTMSGGSETNTYYVSLGHINEGSLYRSNTLNMQRTNFRLAETSTIKSIGLKTTVQLDGYVQEMNRPYSSTNGYNKDDPYFSIFSHIQNKKPWDLSRNKYGMIYDSTDNPLAETSPDAGYAKDQEKVINALASLEWSLPWVKGLKLRASGNYRFYFNEGKRWRKDAPQYGLDSTEPAAGALSEINKNGENGRSYTLQFFADYSKTIKDHTFNILGGYEAQYGFASNYWLSRDSYIFDIDQINPGPASTSKNGGSESENGRSGIVGQLKYNFKDKYFVEGSIRYDGSDNFPTDKRWGAFYSGSLGWSVADEAFWQPLKDRNIFNTFKLRGSYGQVGLDNWDEPYKIGRFAYLSSYGYIDRSYVIGGEMQPGFNEGALPSPDLTWFTTTQVDVGADFSSLGGSLYGSADYFFYKTKGFLYAPSALDVGYTDPLGVGLPKISTDGEHRRAGWEFQLGYKNNWGDLQYNIGANFTYFDQLWAVNPSESLESLKNPYKRTTQEVGYNSVGYLNNGFYQNNEDVYNSVKRLNSTALTSGDLKYEDFNGDGVIDGQDQVRIGKNGFPRGNYGIILDLKYKGFYLNLLFQGSSRFDIYAGSVIQMNDSQGGTTPVFEFQEDYWTVSNRDAMYPRLVSTSGTNGGNNYGASDFWLINGRYFRMKDVKLGYDFKNKLLKKVSWLSHLDVVLSGQNIFTISDATKYGMDPENASNNNYSYPIGRTFAFGVNIGF